MLSGGIVAALPVAHLAIRHWPPSTPLAETPDDLVAWFAEPDEIRTIGEAYLATTEAEGDLSALIDRLPPIFDAQGAMRGDVSAGEVHRQFGDRVEADFRNRDVAMLDGWVLARTEARLCALVVLRNG